MDRDIRVDRSRLCLLLASSSVAALLIGGGTPAMAAGCYTGPFPVTNNGALICIDANATSFSGNIINNDAITAGTAAPTKTGIVVNNSTINGAIINNGAITASSGLGIFVTNNANVSGGISNAGTISGSFAGIVVGTTVNSNAGISTFSGGITNSGTISANNAGILVGSTAFGAGVSTFIGGITNTGTIVAGGTGIQLQGVSTFIGNIVNSGTIVGPAGLVVDGVANFTGNVSNGGTITASAAGIVVSRLSSFTGNVSSSGTITAVIGIFVEDLNVFTGNVSNSGTITADLAGIIVGCSCGIPTFAGNISNSGTISSAGFGIVVGNFTGPFGGITSFSGNIANSGTVTAGTAGIFVAAVSTFTGNVRNSGTIAASGAGIVVTAVRTFTGNVSNSGTIAASGTGIAVTAVRTFIGNISNSGTISVGQSGIGIHVIGVSTFMGGITNSGTISAGNSGAGIVLEAPTFTGNVSNSGTIIGAHTGIFICGCVNFAGGAIVNTGMISGVSGIVVENSGPVSIFNSGTIFSAGTTAIDLTAASGGNTLTLGPGSRITGEVLGFGNDTFQLGGTGSGSFDLGAIGTQYAGFTTFNVVNGTWTVSNTDGQPQAWNVNGGTLAGTGTLPAVNVNNGGTLEPGTIGVAGTFMTITGNLAFQSGAIYLVQMSSTTASRANVGGTVSLAGAVQGYLAPGSYSTKTTYDILDPTSISGKFTGFTSINEPGFGGMLTYTSTDVLLNLTASLGGGGGLSTNQQNVATTINNYFNNGGALPANFFPIFGLSGGNLSTALSQIDGEAATDAEKGAFDMMTEFLDLMLDPYVDGRGGGGGGQANGFAAEQEASLPPDIAMAYASVLKAPPKPAVFDQRWSAWSASFGGTNKTNGDPLVGSSTVTANDYGFAAGTDYHFSPDTVAGFALAGGGTNWGLAQNLGGGRSDAFQAGVYGSTHMGPAYLAADLAFANHRMTTTRTAFAGDQLTARFNAQSYGARIEAGYRYGVPVTGAAFGVTPYAALQAQSFHTPSYSETDGTGGGFGLSYNAMNATDTRSELGARFDDLTVLNAMPLILRGRLAWAHDWVSNPALGAVFQSLPGTSFTVNGAAPPANSALTTAAAELHMTANWSLMAKFDGEFASSSQTYAGTGTLRYTW